jgi:hypothetical protein
MKCPGHLLGGDFLCFFKNCRLQFLSFIWYKQFTERDVWLAGQVLQLSSLSGI